MTLDTKDPTLTAKPEGALRDAGINEERLSAALVIADPAEGDDVDSLSAAVVKSVKEQSPEWFVTKTHAAPDASIGIGDSGKARFSQTSRDERDRELWQTYGVR